MVRIKSYTPPWLNKPSIGHQIFAPSDAEGAKGTSPSKIRAPLGPRRTIARRGTEVFVAVGKEIRWADLVYLKERWQDGVDRNPEQGRFKREGSVAPGEADFSEESVADEAEGFRILHVPVGGDIQQLIMSPFANFMAVVTSHTVRVVLLPDSAHLTAPSIEVIKPKSWTLGPTTHVVDRSAIASVLWHPLGVNGSALVTVTKDAIVRVWELSQNDRWSFDTPSLTIDLQKLADGTSLDQNFAASTDGTTKGFTPDSFEMEVAAACFAGRGSGGWSPMTLWIAMREGDVYALCPLLPTLWAPPPTLIPSLSVSIVANLAANEDDPAVSDQTRLLAQQQLDWMGDLDNQEPRIVEGPPGEPPTEIYQRPARPGIVPRLQGPFELEMSPDTEVDLDLELSDIFAIGEKLDTDELMMGEDEELELEDIEREGLSLSVICLLSSSGQLRICLDVQGVQAQWLPPQNRSKAMGRVTTPPSLLTFQTMDILTAADDAENGWPMFSPDVTSRYSFYVTHPSSITLVSLSPWVFRLESELQGDSEAGSDFRIDLLVSGQSSTRERLYANQGRGDFHLPLAAAAAIRDPDLGYFLLSATPYEPVAMSFDVPEDEFQPIRSVSPSFDRDAEVQPLDFYEPRPIFQPSHVFDESSTLPNLLEKLRTSRYKALVSQEVRCSPATLQVFTDSHKILSEETYRLGVAAAELFRRCEKLQNELKQQIVKANEVKTRVEAITGDDEQNDDEAPETNDDAIQRRIQEAQSRGEQLQARLEAMRRKVSKATSRDLSDKEKSWVTEVKALGSTILDKDETSQGPPKLRQTIKRYNDAMALGDELSEEASKITGSNTQDDTVSSSAKGDLRVPSELRKAKVSQVKNLLERESMLLEAVKSRLERLTVAN
ncbi:hypothetical protein Micbo1qcDRAFT_230118 [Microdochium bolleyi]|uniref:Nuclear pore complex protein An-Nup82 n=1 Tax=Microdochium bolleyi TaxID=196109 RepID=A0A136JK07_9PEZI|nr:hypothetical protein Micbo1qcDRAFT_230118 [Microdochium bolleyi]